MKVAVTGASGFIGRHVLRALGRHPVQITASARRVPSDATPGLRWVALDLAHPPADPYAALGEPDVVMHLAWSGLPNYDSLHHFETELPVQYAFLSSLVRRGLPALVAVGTCFEYGLQSGGLSADRETRPANPYAFAKDVLRKQLEYLRDKTPFAFTWARLFYLFGDGQASTSLYSQLSRAVAEGKKQFPMSGGEQLRDYLPVQTVAERLVELALDRAGRGIVNVCSGEPVSVRRLVEGWIAAHGWDIVPDLGRFEYSKHEPLAFWGLETPNKTPSER